MVRNVMPRLTALQLKSVLTKKARGIPSELRTIITKQRERNAAPDAQDSGEGKVSNVEPRLGYEPLRKGQLALDYTGRARLIVKVYRKRLTDPLGDCTKYHIDGLRYAGLLKDDSDAEISLTEEPHQKVEDESEERVEITLSYEGAKPLCNKEKKDLQRVLDSLRIAAG